MITHFLAPQHFRKTDLRNLSGILLICYLLWSPATLGQNTKENADFKLALNLYRDGLYDLAAEQLKQLLPQGMSLPEMALRFILNEPAVSAIIPGMRKARHVRSNLAQSDAGPLPEVLHRALRAHRWVRTPTTWSQ